MTIVYKQSVVLNEEEEVATRLAGAKKFTLCDAKDGFHQVVLDDASSYLTTFNSPFGY